MLVGVIVGDRPHVHRRRRRSWRRRRTRASSSPWSRRRRSPTSTISSRRRTQLNKVFATVPEKEHVFTINGLAATCTRPSPASCSSPGSERTRTQKQILQEPAAEGRRASPAAQAHLLLAARRCRARPADRRCSSSSPRPRDYPQLADVLRRCRRSRRAKSGLFIFTDSDLKFETPQVEFKIDHDKANRLGITMPISAARSRRCSAATTSTGSISTAAATR